MVTIRVGFAGIWVLAVIESALCAHPETCLAAWALSMVALGFAVRFGKVKA